MLDMATPACPWEAGNSFLVLICLCKQLFFFSLLNFFNSTHKFSVFFLSDFPPSLTGGRVSGCLELGCLLGLNHGTCKGAHSDFRKGVDCKSPVPLVMSIVHTNKGEKLNVLCQS